MKKLNYLFAGILAAATLVSCGNSTEEETKTKKRPLVVDVTGGTAEEQEALLDGINKSIVQKNGKDPITQKSKTTLKEDEGDNIYLTTSQVVNRSGKKYTVKIDWNVPMNNYVNEVFDDNNGHQIIDVKYQGYGKENGSISWELKKVTCGDAVSANPGVTYTATVVGQEYYHEDMKIADILKVTEHNPVKEVYDSKNDKTYYYPSTFDTIDYEYHEDAKYSPYFTGNNEGKEKNYRYVNVKGKVVYAAPDGNWGIIADGDNVMEIYAGASPRKLTSTFFPNMAKQYVTVVGNLSEYCGNIQIGWITQIKEANASDITEPSLNYATITETEIASWHWREGFGEKQAVTGLPNSLRTVTGTYVNGSLKDRNNAAQTASSLVHNRFTFKLKVGEEEITVAYDYHCGEGGNDRALFNKLKSALSQSNAITVKGTMRYSGNESDPFILNNNPGVWTIIPFDANSVTF